MLNSAVIRVRTSRLLNLATYLAIVIMTLIGVVVMSETIKRAVAVILCLTFALLYAFGYRVATTRPQLILYFAAQIVLVTLLLALDPNAIGAFNFLFVILSIQVVLTWSERETLLWIGLFWIITSASVLWALGTSGVISALFNAAGYFLFGVFGNALHQAESARRENQRLLEELRAAQSQLQQLAIAQERNRLARDLHDSVKQQVFATAMQLGAIRASLDTNASAAREHLTEAERLVQQVQQELNVLIHELRPTALAGQGLGAALRGYLTDWSRQSSIAAEVQVQDERALPLVAEEALFRVVQEALSNVARHSGATEVQVHLIYEPTLVMLTVADNGHGFRNTDGSNGVGLDSMRERMAVIGGGLELDAPNGQGTRVSAIYEYERLT